MLGSNQRQSACKTGALPTELIAYIHLVGRAGVEPAQSQTGDLQSLGLATCSASPHSLLILDHVLEVKVKALFNLFLFFLVGVDGLEPSISTVSEWCSNQLNYTPMECPTGFEPAKNGFAIRCLTIQPQTHWRSQWDLNPCC